MQRKNFFKSLIALVAAPSVLGEIDFDKRTFHQKFNDDAIKNIVYGDIEYYEGEWGIANNCTPIVSHANGEKYIEYKPNDREFFRTSIVPCYNQTTLT